MTVRTMIVVMSEVSFPSYRRLWYSGVDPGYHSTLRVHGMCIVGEVEPVSSIICHMYYHLIAIRIFSGSNHQYITFTSAKDGRECNRKLRTIEGDILKRNTDEVALITKWGKDWCYAEVEWKLCFCLWISFVNLVLTENPGRKQITDLEVQLIGEITRGIWLLDNYYEDGMLKLET